MEHTRPGTQNSDDDRVARTVNAIKLLLSNAVHLLFLAKKSQGNATASEWQEQMRSELWKEKNAHKELNSNIISENERCLRRSGLDGSSSESAFDGSTNS